MQTEEVAGIVRAELFSFVDLWKDVVESIKVEGILVDEQGESRSVERIVGKESFVPHPLEYYERVIDRLKKLTNLTSL